MNHPVVLLEEAARELGEATAYYDRIDAGLGDSFVENIDRALDRIARGPRQAPIVFSTARIALVERFPFVIVCEFTHERVRVLAIQHAHRDPAKWQGRVP